MQLSVLPTGKWYKATWLCCTLARRSKKIPYLITENLKNHILFFARTYIAHILEYPPGFVLKSLNLRSTFTLNTAIKHNYFGFLSQFGHGLWSLLATTPRCSNFKFCSTLTPTMDACFNKWMMIKNTLRIKRIKRYYMYVASKYHFDDFNLGLDSKLIHEGLQVLLHLDAVVFVFWVPQLRQVYNEE